MNVENTELADALTDVSPEPILESGAPAVSEDEALGAAFDRIMTNNGANRDVDTGKFTSPSPKAADADSASSGDEEGAGEIDGAATAPDASPAPANWQGLDDAWKSLPAEHREKVKNHFDDLHRRMSDQGRQLASVKPFADTMAEAAKSIPMFNSMQPQEIARKATELAAIAVELKRSPVETLIKVAQSTGALDALAARLSGKEPEPADTQIASLQREVATLKERLLQASDPTQIETHVSRAIEGRAAQDVVNQFASDPANSFFADVEPQLPTFVVLAKERNPGASPKEVLKTAYDMAVNAIPEVRAKAQAAAKTAAAANDQKRTEAARKAASINVKSTSTGKTNLTEHDALSAAYDRAMAS